MLSFYPYLWSRRTDGTESDSYHPHHFLSDARNISPLTLILFLLPTGPLLSHTAIPFPPLSPLPPRTCLCGAMSQCGCEPLPTEELYKLFELDPITLASSPLPASTSVDYPSVFLARTRFLILSSDSDRPELLRIYVAFGTRPQTWMGRARGFGQRQTASDLQPQ